MQLDHTGEIEWLYGRGPAPVLGPCRHGCKHARSIIAQGPTFDRYTLVECNGVRPGGGETECAGRCRAWMDSWRNVVTDWLQVDVDPATVTRASRRVARLARSSANAEVLASIDVADDDEMPEPCQPIGCDNGYHLPGCCYAASDQTPSDATPDPSEADRG